MSLQPRDWQQWGLEVEPPQRVDDVEHFDWSETADLVVVGLGGAGVAAALEGVERGLEVVAVDRHAGGGSTTANGGVFYAGGGTRIQREAGEDDSPEEMYKYLKLEVGDVVADATLRQFCDESVETVDWLIEHGAKLNSKVWKEKTSYPPLDCFLGVPLYAGQDMVRKVNTTPITIEGNAATIKLHSNKLEYGTEYYVAVSDGVFTGTTLGAGL